MRRVFESPPGHQEKRVHRGSFFLLRKEAIRTRESAREKGARPVDGRAPSGRGRLIEEPVGGRAGTQLGRLPLFPGSRPTDFTAKSSKFQHVAEIFSSMSGFQGRFLGHISDPNLKWHRFRRPQRLFSALSARKVQDIIKGKGASKSEYV